MAYETGAPPPPEHTPIQVEDVPITKAARPARGFDATSIIVEVAGPPPGVTTYRLRGTETTRPE
jgi:hypothetical protein